MSGATRWVVLIVAMGAAGWAAYTVRERGLIDPPISPEPAPDARLEAFVEQGHDKLVAGDLDAAAEQFHKASGLDEGDPRVQEGLVLVEVGKAERTWWQLRTMALDAPGRLEAVKRLDHDVDAARHLMAEAMRKTKDPAAHIRFRLYERRLNTMVVVAFAEIGERERADGALNARLARAPQHDMLQAYLGAASASGSASASAAPSSSAPAPASAAPSASAPNARDVKSRDEWGERHYEFDDEPKHVPKVEGELEIPVP